MADNESETVYTFPLLSFYEKLRNNLRVVIRLWRDGNASFWNISQWAHGGAFTFSDMISNL